MGLRVHLLEVEYLPCEIKKTRCVLTYYLQIPLNPVVLHADFLYGLKGSADKCKGSPDLMRDFREELHFLLIEFLFLLYGEDLLLLSKLLHLTLAVDSPAEGYESGEHKQIQTQGPP